VIRSGWIGVVPLACLAQAVAASGAPRIPLCPGLQIVTAVSQPNGDYESIKTIEAVDGATVRLKYAAEHPVTDFLASDFGQVRRTTLYRSVRRQDLDAATLYAQRYIDGMPELIPETTAIGVSSAVLKALKTQGHAQLGLSNAYSGDVPADRNQSPNLYDFMTTAEIKRLDTVQLPVVVNGEKVLLPAVRARGDFVGDLSELFVLDDESNPLALRFRLGIDGVPPMNRETIELCQTMQQAAPDVAKTLCGRTTASDRETLQVVKISYRCETPAAPSGNGGAAELEQQLAAAGKAVIYDIHFSFDSDRIREESTPRLAEIAEVMRKHPDWSLSIGGHTDAIGGQTYNQDLSRRRAAAVKDALVKRYGIAASRLDTAGYGASAPRDTNDTIEGRARNRRVELVKR